MEFSWTYEKSEKRILRTFLREQGISRKLLAKIKFQGGRIFVNGKEETVVFPLTAEDKVAIIIPDEEEFETVLVDPTPLDIVFEDEHLLVLNKPSGVASIPAQYHPNGAMVNRVKAYCMAQGYKDLVTHVVTRLDRDTSGLMLFAKHGFAHAKLDTQLRTKTFKKKYQTIVSGAIDQLEDHGRIELPIARNTTSIMRRKVDSSGKYALTEYWVKKQKNGLALIDVQLHTGRTHQIRVHFSALGCPLIGDEMYGGRMDAGITRQALHCSELRFTHPFTGEELMFQLPLADDMRVVAESLEH